MKRRSNRISRLREVARVAEQRALQLLAREKANLNAVATQQHQLVTYQHEYADRMRETRVLSPSQLINFHRFFSGLSDAVRQQEQAVILQSARVDEEKSRWRYSWNRKHSMEKVEVSVSRAESLERQRTEEKRITDMAGSRVNRD